MKASSADGLREEPAVTDRDHAGAPAPRGVARVNWLARGNQRTVALPAGPASGTARTRRPGAPLDRRKRLGI